MHSKKVKHKMENNDSKSFALKIVRVITLIDVFDNILIDEKSHKNIFIYDISYKKLIDSKPLRIRFDKIDGFIRIYNGTRYLTLFGSEIFDAIYAN